MVKPLRIAGRKGTREWEERNKLVHTIKIHLPDRSFQRKTVSKLQHNEIMPSYPALFRPILCCLCLTYSLPPNESCRAAKVRVKLEQATIIGENKHKKDI